MRDLLASDRAEAAEAAEAVDLFVLTAAKHLGAIVTALGGLDAVVFTVRHRRERGPGAGRDLRALRLAGSATGRGGECRPCRHDLGARVGGFGACDRH